MDLSETIAFKATRLSAPSFQFGTSIRAPLCDFDDTPGAGRSMSSTFFFYENI